LLATPATVASGAYDRAVRASDPNVELVAVPCPDLAPIIQGGFPFDQRVVDTVRAYCEPLRASAVDTVILGCTHYPLVAPMLQRTLGRAVTLVSSGHAVARRVVQRTGTLPNSVIAADSLEQRTLEQLRRFREQLETKRFGQEERRRAEDRIREELQDARARTLNGRVRR